MKLHKKGFLSCLLGIVLCFPGVGLAIPYLQLDIAGGTYDMADESIVTSADAFTLYVFAQPSAVVLADTFFLSIAVTPKSDIGTNAGTFVFGGATFNTATDMVYGVPPIGATMGSLGKHDIFKTIYLEYAFQFDALKTTTAYNTQDNPGATLFDSTNNGMFYRDFAFDVSGLTEGYELHFDLYNSEFKIAGKKSGETVGDFAPFSHDAGTTPGAPVPEPSTLLLLGAGLIGLATYRRRKS